MKNSALQSLLDMAKKDGVKNNETTKQNIYQTKYFEGVSDEKTEKKIRRMLRDNVLSYLQLIVGSKDKKDFSENYKKFENVYKETYINQTIDFSIFDTLRKNKKKKTLQGAISNFEKYNK